MALDHARGFLARNHPAEFWGSALPDYQGDWLAFVTRLVTHPCAPGFMFLMGTGAVLFRAVRLRQGWSEGRVIAHLVLRGAILIALGQFSENAAASFNSAGAVRGESYGLRVPGAPAAVSVVLGVLYGLGTSLVASALLMRLPILALVSLAAAAVAATHLVTPDASRLGDPIPHLTALLVVPGFSSPFISVYPTIPWLAATLAGVAFGRAVEQERARAFRLVGWLGVAFMLAFVVLRATGTFGSLHPVQPGWIGFLNVTKYPPALTFLLLTLGVNFLLLAAFERVRESSRWLVPLHVFGSVPLFFFIAHLWLYAALGRFFPAGMPVAQMYPFWLLGLAILYLPCAWYGRFRRGRPPGSPFHLL